MQTYEYLRTSYIFEFPFYYICESLVRLLLQN